MTSQRGTRSQLIDSPCARGITSRLQALDYSAWGVERELSKVSSQWRDRTREDDFGQAPPARTEKDKKAACDLHESSTSRIGYCSKHCPACRCISSFQLYSRLSPSVSAQRNQTPSRLRAHVIRFFKSQLFARCLYRQPCGR